MKKKHLIITVIGFCAGSFLALFDTATNNIDVAPIDSDFTYLLQELKNNFNFLKTFVYGVLGSIMFLTILILFNFLRKKINPDYNR